MKRIFTFFLAFAVAFSFFVFPFSARAVVNPAFIYSGMFAFLSSAGYSFSTSASSGDVPSLMDDLYSNYRTTHSDALTISQFEGQISLSQFGQYIFTQTAVIQLQDFADWIQSNFSISSGGSSVTVVSPPSSGGVDYTLSDYSFLSVFSDNYGSMPVVASSSPYDAYYLRNGRYQFYRASDQSGLFYYSVKTNTSLFLCYVSASPFTVPVSFYSSSSLSDPGNPITTTSYSSTSFTINSLPVYFAYFSVGSNYSVDFYNSCSLSDSQLFNGSNLPQYGYVILYGQSQSVLGSLAMSIGNQLVDYVEDIAADQALVVDVGLSAGATQTEAIDHIGDAIVADTAVAVDSQVVAEAVIDTPVQPYPDVDSLGLPQLGLALTTRFPFSIPWDISAIYSALSAPSEPPVKTFDLIPASVMARWGINANTSITIDLTEQKYAVLLAIIHWSCILGFCLGLAVMTKRYVWTTGG